MAVDHEIARALVGGVNHHLRTPLTVVLGHAELLVDREQELPPEVRQSLACLLRAAQRLDEVVAGVSDVMDVACVLPRSVDSVDISLLIADEVATWRDRAEQRGIQLLVRAGPGPHCIADARRLRRALHELLDNALTYAPDQSTVRVAATTSATRVRIRVRDEGAGIDPGDRERLVRPFERGTHPRQARGGRGMGLAVASAVAARHGGRLILSDTWGRGFQACVELPGPHAPQPRVRRRGSTAVGGEPAVGRPSSC